LGESQISGFEISEFSGGHHFYSRCGPELGIFQFRMASSVKNQTETGVQEERFGRFYLKELLNSGGMADIWFVTDGRGKPFALRKLKKEFRFSFTSRRRFVHGCKILSQLNESDYIVGYVEHGKADGLNYLLMDYVEASNLKELYARHDPVLTENVAQILIDMAVGLSHVHESGYMHLDYKPENILVTRNGRVRLIDFDLAQQIPEKPKKMSTYPGTPGYMAPEQLQRREFDARVDIFAYGVAAYELLTNQKPFPGDSPGEILAAQLAEGGPAPLREHNPDVPPALEAVVLKCLARDPEYRYPLSGVLVRDLESALYR